MMSDPIDDLLIQAKTYAKKRLDDPTLVSFDYKFSDTTSYKDISSGKHDFVQMREDDDAECNQRGMYAKCKINAGTKVVISKPIVVHWDAEDDEEEDGDSDVEEEEHDADLKGEEEEEEDVEEGFDYDAGNTWSGDDDEQKKPASAVKEAASDCDVRRCSSVGSSDDDDEDEESLEGGPTGTTRNGILILRALEKIKETPKLWTNTLSQLFPRDEESALSLPPWFCSDASVGMEIEKQMAELPNLTLFGKNKTNAEVICKEIAMRLPLIVRYNVLSIETCSELFVYPDVNNGGMSSLAGTGLYGPDVSYFNHSCKPNLSRYSIGDVMFFVTNRDIEEGEELCFSYIEHELLCESAVKRSALLDMDFELDDDDGSSNGKEEPPSKKQKVAKMPSKDEDDDDAVPYPLIDAEMQSELMATPLKERLELINELLNQKADPTQDYQCDKFQLHILKAITLEGLGQSNALDDDNKLGLEHALSEWEAAIDFAVKNFPPLDETTIALHVQAAMCVSTNTSNERYKSATKKEERHVGNNEKAKYHADKALEMHNFLFGGGKQRFLLRYGEEFKNGRRMRAGTSKTQWLSNLEYLWGFTTEMWSALPQP